MAKGFFISKTLLVVAVLASLAAVAAIIALAVLYSEAKNASNSPETGSPSESPGTGSTPDSPGTSTPPAENKPWHRYRLPSSLKPYHYQLSLWPRIEPPHDFTFSGNSTVFFHCQNATDLILIHCNKLNLTRFDQQLAKLEAVDGSPAPQILKSWLQNTTQYLVLELSSKLSAGKKYSLFTNFRGFLADDLSGFYRSEYINEAGKRRYIATTQMQPTDARKAFPCFDEPAMKATFNITLYHKREYSAISNMPAISNETTKINNTEWIITTFDKTPNMSTYLLAFIVSDFGFLRADTNETLIRIWARKQAIKEKQGDYALNVTGTILSYFERYYNITYPLPKSDQIALPDFNAGAMENWGLVTYRETALLYHPEQSSAGNKERVLMVIAHELAHQWFGNLVTIKWWNDLWLNEGFASYVQYLGANEVEKEWNVKDIIILDDVYRVFAVDALASSHPLSSREDEINTPAEINELFDAISYSKGASVLRMLSSFLGEDVFTAGLTTYLSQFSYGNTEYLDLFHHLQQAATNTSLPASVAAIMKRWTLQMGFPVVTINTDNGSISQRHFLLDPDSVVTRPSPFGYVWIVPITWMKGGSEQKMIWLQKSQENNSNFASGNDWILANINVTGYYRVNYDEKNWERLVDVLKSNHTVLPIINRAQIMADSFNLARAKYRNTTAALNTTLYLHKEREYIPWEAALGNLAYFKLMFDRTEVFGPMKDYMKNQVTPLYCYFKNKTENWKKTPSNLMEQYNTINAVSVACGYGVRECQVMAREMYKAWMETSKDDIIPVNLKTSIYCNGIAAGAEKEWDFAWEKLQNTTLATEADKLRSALACTKQPWLLNRYLEYTLDPTKIRKQDATSTIVAIASNVVGQSLAWDFVRANWQYIFERYGGGSFSFSGLIERVTERFSTKFELQQLEQFKKDNEHVGFGSGTRALEQALERTKANIRWLSENKDSVNNWFINAAKNSQQTHC